MTTAEIPGSGHLTLCFSDISADEGHEMSFAQTVHSLTFAIGPQFGLFKWSHFVLKSI